MSTLGECGVIGSGAVLIRPTVVAPLVPAVIEELECLKSIEAARLYLRADKPLFVFKVCGLAVKLVPAYSTESRAENDLGACFNRGPFKLGENDVIRAAYRSSCDFHR